MKLFPLAPIWTINIFNEKKEINLWHGNGGDGELPLNSKTGGLSPSEAIFPEHLGLALTGPLTSPSLQV